MSQAHYIQPTGVSRDSLTVRLGSGTGAAGLTSADTGKLVRAVAGQDSLFNLCAVGEPIEAIITSVEQATSAGYAIGGIDDGDRFFAIADGSEAAGTGALAVGDYFVAGTPIVKGTALGVNGSTAYPKVRKATVQIGVTPADLAGAGRQAQLAAAGAWRVVSLFREGTGAVGTTIVVAPVGKKI